MEKTIQINPDFLQIRKIKKKKKTAGGNDKDIHSKKLRKQFLERIKDYQKNRKKKGGHDNTNNTLNTKTSIEFLKKIQQERRKKQSKTQPEKKHYKADPPYGILKGGKKPLYRDWVNKTVKKKALEASPEKELDKKSEKNIIKKKRKKKRVRKLTLGRDIKNRIVRVIIKNKTMKKKVEDKKIQLKKKSIYEIKKHLRRKGLIKIGSAAPKDVLKQIYMDSNMAGEVFNKSPEILLHNFLNEKS